MLYSYIVPVERGETRCSSLRVKTFNVYTFYSRYRHGIIIAMFQMLFLSFFAIYNNVRSENGQSIL